jgi:hypothetical protein
VTDTAHAPRDDPAGGELAPVGPEVGSTPSRAVTALWEADQLAQIIANTPFVPAAYRGRPEAVAAVLLYGQELGFEPLTALQLIDVVEGRPQLSSIGARARVLAGGHELEILESTGECCVVRGRRRGVDRWTHVGWTIAMAQAAGLTRKSNWRDYPRAMLAARSTLELCRLVFPDLVFGLDRRPSAHQTQATSLPAADVDDEDAAEIVALTATAPQLTKIAMLYGQGGVDTREERHHLTRMITGLDFGDTTKNLPRAVASQLIEDLGQAVQVGRNRGDSPDSIRTAFEDLAAARADRQQQP